MNRLKFLSCLFLSVFLWVGFIGFDSSAHAEDAPENTTAHPPPRTAIPHPSPPQNPVRPNSPHGPSKGAQPFMKKLESYNKRLQENPEDMEALVFLANANFDIQRFENAEALYLRVLKIDPNNLHIRTDLASVYRNLEDPGKAVETLRVVLSLNPNHEVALYNIGIILLNDKEDFDGAAEAWERLVKINPNDPLADALKEQVKRIRNGELKREKAKEIPPTH
ncbi:MAG: tetratricopeptide repeat protein [Nitrospirae bacterium]|nr:tetratricopeptide repeat protein [Candidatus Manganitrophaceae bacterium]